MSWERALVWGLASFVVAAPLLVGGVNPPVQLALSAAALVLVALYALHRRERGLRLLRIVTPAAIALGWTVLQLVPLPAALVGILSPHARELRADTGAGALIPLTVDVPATVLEVVKGFACLGLLVVAVGLLRSSRRARPVLVTIALVGTLVAVITIVSRLAGSQTILGFYRPRSMPGSGLWGTFVDGNHAASLLALSALTAFGIAFERRGGPQRLLLPCAIVSAAVLAWTGSRAGAGAFAVGGLALASVALVRRMGLLAGLLSALAIVVCLSAVTLASAELLRMRLAPPSVDSLWDNQKVRGWHDGLELAAAYPWTGVGRGAFEAPLSAFRRADEAVRLVYPENILVETASEWGFPVALGVALLVVLALGRAAPRLAKVELGVVGAASGVLAVLLHELADFGLEMPGVALPTAIALGLVLARCEEQRDEERTRNPRLPLRATAAAVGAWACALVVGVWAARHTLDVDFERLAAASKADAPTLKADLAAAIARHPADDHLELLAAREGLRHREPTAMHHLNRALLLHPANAQAHVLAARALLRYGHRAQAALEYRLAIECGLTPPYDELLKLLGAQAVDAMPQRPTELLGLARYVARWNAPLADEIARRAVEAGDGSEAIAAERLRIALGGSDLKVIHAAALALDDAQPGVESSELVLAALARAGDVAATEAALDAAVKRHPEASGLVLLGARLRYDRGDLPGARALLKRSGDGSFTLAERQQAEELLAMVADKAGDVDAAVLARARARSIARKLKESTMTNAVYSPRP